MKIYFFIVFVVFSFFLKNSNQQQDSKLDAPWAEKIFKDLNIQNEKEIPKRTFREFLFRLITRDEKMALHERVFYDEMIERMTKDVPEIVETEKMGEYIDTEKFNKIIEEAIMEQYGGEAYKQYANSVPFDASTIDKFDDL